MKSKTYLEDKRQLTRMLLLSSVIRTKELNEVSDRDKKLVSIWFIGDLQELIRIGENWGIDGLSPIGRFEANRIRKIYSM